MSITKLSVTTLAVVAMSATTATARDNVQVAGSSTVLPYAAIVAEYFGENFDFATPVVESGGSSAGLKRFCEGVGENTIDIANSSRQIKASEIAACADAGVTDIIEVRIGYDGIVFASDINGNSFQFTPEDWYKALVAEHFVDGALVPNTFSSWNEVNADLPDQPIQAFIPGTKHGTREVFEEKVLLAGCEEGGYLHAMTDAGIDEDTAFFENNTDKLQVATMSNVVPTTESIASGDYPVSRPLYFYIKAAHIDVIPGVKEFAEFFISDDMAGPDGPLAEYGLVSDPELLNVQEAVMNEVLLAN